MVDTDGSDLTKRAERQAVRVADALLVAVGALMLLPDLTVLLFHLVFVLLSLQAFYLRLRPFIIRAAIWVAIASVEVLLTVQAGETQPEELIIELPLLSTILAVVFLIARRRDAAMRALEQGKRDERERMLADTRAREEFVSMVVHELRNPLLGIRAAGRRLASGKADTSIATALASEADHSLDLLESLSDMARIDTGSIGDVLAPVDMFRVVERALATTDAGAHRVKVVGLPPLRVFGNERRLIQVVRNLVSNAAKYSPPDAPIEVTVGYDSGDREQARVTVRDRGAGIPPGERDKLFQRFARLSTAGAAPGSGLGLYISRGIVEAHGGTIAADWPSGGGTEFSFTIALADEEHLRLGHSA